MVKEGYAESEVMEMTLDKLDLCSKSIHRRMLKDRAIMVVDTAAAIAGIFGKKDSLTKYLETLQGKDHG